GRGGAHRGAPRPHSAVRRRRRRRGRRGAPARPAPVERAGPPQQPGGRVPAPDRPDTGGLMTHPTWSVFEYQLVAYRRVWRGTVFSSFLLPVLFFVAMGMTVGSYVDRAGSLGVHYLDYIAPGLLASTAMQVAVSESTYPVLGG